MTPLEVRAAATHTLHLPSIPSDDVLLAGLLARVEQTEMAALEMSRRRTLGGVPAPFTADRWENVGLPGGAEPEYAGLGDHP